MILAHNMDVLLRPVEPTSTISTKYGFKIKLNIFSVAGRTGAGIVINNIRIVNLSKYMNNKQQLPDNRN